MLCVITTHVINGVYCTQCLFLVKFETAGNFIENLLLSNYKKLKIKVS